MSKVFLERILINGYRSCNETVFEPDPSLSGLIGINGAGKTNILNAIRLLNPNNFRGDRLYRDRKDEQNLPETILDADFRVGKKLIFLRLILTIASGKGEEEVLSFKEMWNFKEYGEGDRWVEIPFYMFEDSSGGSKSITYYHYYYSEKIGTKGKPSFEADIKKVLGNSALSKSVKSIIGFRKKIKYYSASQFTDPTRCPSSFELDGSGELERIYFNRPLAYHLQFLFDLYSLKKSNPDLYHEYEQFVSTKMLGLVSRISWKPVRLSSNTVEIKSGGTIKKVRQYKTLVIPKVQIGSSHITFNQLSEGTFKTLALIFYIMTDMASLLLIEEPEVCIHHGLLRRILGIIVAHSRDRQVVFTTHSDLVLDSISIDNVFVVEMRRSITNVNSLSDWAGSEGMEALREYLDECGTLGDYWRSGGLYHE